MTGSEEQMGAHRWHASDLVVAAVTMLAVVSAAHAKESAQALLNRGNSAFAAGNYPAALEAFEKGNRVSPSPVFQRSVGYSLLKLYQHEKARAALEQYLKKYPKQADAKKIQDLVDGLDVVVQTKVSVTSTPPGADLYIDAEAAGKVAATPFNGTIDPGKHILILKRGGYHTTVRPFTIAPKQSLTLDVSLEAALEVDSVPSGADVFIDGENGPSLGKTKLSAGIAPGKHKVFIKLAGYKTRVESVDVAPPRPVTLSAVLGLGVRVVSNPGGAKVEVNGKPLGGVTPVEESLLPGEYKITVSLAGYKPFNVMKKVAAGADNLVQATLEGGLLTMRTDIEGASVQVDGRELGSTPTEKATVPLGHHQVKVSHPDRRSWRGAVDFEDGQMVDAQVKLGGPTWPLWVAAAATGVGVIMAAVGGGMMVSSRNDHDNEFLADGKTCATEGDCSYQWHHLTTAGFVVGGTALGTGLLYYLIWGRPRAEVRKVPIATETRTVGKAAAAAGY